MVKRMMNIGKSVTEFRNPSQTSAYEWINLYVIEKQFCGTGMIVWTRYTCIDVKRILQSTSTSSHRGSVGKLTDVSFFAWVISETEILTYMV